MPTVELIVLIANYAIKYGIPAAQKLAQMLHEHGESVPLEKWNEIFEISKKSEEDYVSGFKIK